ncbi:SDR family NAD(P)-dependent oxidoreductase [Amycolatopsis jejuensis]|uniref:SDR family NAD(P)-dependent oxidoreductase n=1 Tax=Amycolatopsis jejuensis TaxID=330084 RepID=UPI000525558F|nr:SDR family NAD(P)-dependent oxidoreductase [Amycolatopsis jejuensis]
MKLDGRIALVLGAGQTPGETVGNGRASAMRYARSGATVIAADRDLESAEATAAMIVAEGGRCVARRADVTSEADLAALVEDVVSGFGRIDVLHNNVGVSLSAGDAPVTEITAEAFAAITAINLQGMVLTCKYVLPHMRAQESGVITNIGSIASAINHPLVAYRTTKAAVVSLTEHLAITNAPYGIRVNCLLPGLIATPMAIDNPVRRGRPRDELVAERNARVPLRGLMGTAWDVANAALFLASDDASFITGAAIPIDGGQALNIG